MCHVCRSIANRRLFGLGAAAVHYLGWWALILGWLFFFPLGLDLPSRLSLCLVRQLWCFVWRQKHVFYTGIYLYAAAGRLAGTQRKVYKANFYLQIDQLLVSFWIRIHKHITQHKRIRRNAIVWRGRRSKPQRNRKTEKGTYVPIRPEQIRISLTVLMNRVSTQISFCLKKNS